MGLFEVHPKNSARIGALWQEQLLSSEPDLTSSKIPVQRISLIATDFSKELLIHRGSGLILSKTGLSPKAIHSLRRLVSYNNPEFFAKQAMRLSTYGIPRMTVAYDETAEMIQLPRGAEAKLIDLLD